jgi:hypothetical protein
VDRARLSGEHQKTGISGMESKGGVSLDGVPPFGGIAAEHQQLVLGGPQCAN